MPANHAMIDLETMGNSPQAAIVAVGALAFDPLGQYVAPPGDLRAQPEYLYRKVALASSMAHGLKVGASTVIWWLGQSQEAQRELLFGNIIALPEALGDFLQWFRANNIEYVWGHGSCFDIVILQNAFERCADITKSVAPWDFRKVRDTRTLFDITPGFGSEFKLSAEGKHIATWDAWRQAQAVQWSHRKIASLATPVAISSEA